MMKKKAAAVITAILTAAALMAGCGSSAASSSSEAAATEEAAPAEESAKTEETAEAQSADGDAKEFIFVCPIVGLEYWNMCADGIAKADEELGTKTQIVGPTDPATFVTEVVTHMQSAIAAKPDGILCYGGVESFPQLLQEAADNGVPVCCIDSDCADTTNRFAYVGTNPYNAGFASGEAMIEATGGEGKVVILTSSVSAEKEQAEIEAFKDAIKDTKLEVIAMEETNADLATGVTKMESLIQTYPDLTAVLGTSAYDVQAAAKVKVEYGLDNVHLVGYDDQEETLKYIRDGVIDAIIVQDPYNMGYLGVKTMYEYVTNGSVENDNVDTGTTTVTIDNVDSYK